MSEEQGKAGVEYEEEEEEEEHEVRHHSPGADEGMPSMCSSWLLAVAAGLCGACRGLNKSPEAPLPQQSWGQAGETSPPLRPHGPTAVHSVWGVTDMAVGGDAWYHILDHDHPAPEG